MSDAMSPPRAVSPSDRGIPLKKALGQHHLSRGAQCRPLLEFLRPHGLRVIEIGPGGGVLTRELLRERARVMAIELDLAWGFALVRRRGLEAVTLVLGDALDLAWDRLPEPTLVTGNLPFSISTVLIESLLLQRAKIPRAAFLVQREVAERLSAAPGDEGYGSLSVLTAACAEVEVLGRVKRGSFRPPPKVDAAFVGLTLKPPPFPDHEMKRFASTVRAAFSQRRKQLINSLASAWGRERARRILLEAGVEPQRRAEELSLEQFATLHRVDLGS